MAYINKIVVNGQEVNANQFEGILDKNGHARFIDGDIVAGEISGVTFTYSKWSLSGTHLMIVLAGTVTANTSIVTGSWGSVRLPQWILDKIYPIYNDYVDVDKTFKLVDLSTYESENMNFHLKKYSDQLIVSCGTAKTSSANSNAIRIQFDLLVDNN